MSVDAIFTPPELASELIHSATHTSPKLIADFCAGDGELIRSALRKWPAAAVIATDLTPWPLMKLKKQRFARVGKCDFLNERSRQACAALQGALSSVDLILLNPPFSHRGARALRIQIDDCELLCSPAVAFLVNCVPYLKQDGQMIAILPAGCIRKREE